MKPSIFGWNQTKQKRKAVCSKCTIGTNKNPQSLIAIAYGDSLKEYRQLKFKMENCTESITAIFTQKVKLGRESDYETWVINVTQTASTYTGYISTNVIRPQGKVRPEYVIIFRFDCYEHLKTCIASDDIQSWIVTAQTLVESPPKIEGVSGMETWCSTPNQQLKTPPRYKTILLTWPVVYTLISLLNKLIRPFLIQVFPSWLALFIICGVMVTLSTYIVMPQVTRLFYGWLYKNE